MTRQAVSAAESIPNLPILEEHDNISTVGLLLVTGDRGLAGSFNSQIIRAGNTRARELDEDVHWYAVGRRGVSSIQFRGYELAGGYTGFTDRPAYADAREVADEMIQHYVDGHVDRVEILYNGYISPMTQEVRHETLLPLQQADVLGEDEGEEGGEATSGDEGDSDRRTTAARCGSTSRTPRRSSSGSPLTTWRFRSTGRCSSRRHRSTARA